MASIWRAPLVPLKFVSGYFNVSSCCSYLVDGDVDTGREARLLRLKALLLLDILILLILGLNLLSRLVAESIVLKSVLVESVDVGNGEADTDTAPLLASGSLKEIAPLTSRH